MDCGSLLTALQPTYWSHSDFISTDSLTGSFNLFYVATGKADWSLGVVVGLDKKCHKNVTFTTCSASCQHPQLLGVEARHMNMFKVCEEEQHFVTVV